MQCCTVAKNLGCTPKIKLRRLKEGTKHLMLLAEVPIVLYQVIVCQKIQQILLPAAGA